MLIPRIELGSLPYKSSILTDKIYEQAIIYMFYNKI
jgi:hypothetical protein